ncbi:MAG: hypothetical protein E6Q97_35730 [Desulfurellales bacterium]|nr:MAG: hypothetical protein E6Q97_35730 [Desulfurellales bacterium]
MMMVNLPHYAVKMETMMKPSEQKSTHLTDIDAYAESRPPRWGPLLLAAAILIAIILACAACVPPAKGGYGNSNPQPAPAMGSANGYTGQAGS